jgi:penicillin V acylase-like amidase (Ntn superfamily)
MGLIQKLFGDHLIIIKHSTIIFFSLLIGFSNSSDACTIFVKANRDKILVGNNEDYYEPETKIWFFPKSSNFYGRVIWGYDRFLHKYQGGMNDQGLFVDINAINFSGWADDPQKPNLPGDYIEYILTQCATVDDVIKLTQEFDIDLGWIKLFLADAHGKSAIFEWLDGKVNVIQGKGDYQISTNYLSPNEHTEPRNQIAKKILGSQEEPTIDLIRKTLAATSYDTYFAQTMYSTICDLKNKKFYLYHFHYFEEVVTFDLNVELQKGETSYKIPSLFNIRTQNEYFFNKMGTQIGARDLRKIIDEEGINVAFQQFNEMKEKTRTFHQYEFPEYRLRSLGLNYVSQNELKEAIGVFKLNIKIYPKSTQTYSDLADAYMKDGNKKLAIENYQKVLDFIPDDKKTLSILNKLKNQE